MAEQTPIPNEDFEEELEAKKEFWEFFYRCLEARNKERKRKKG